MSYRDMLPVVLSAIMQSGSELSFAKDKNFRYICASRSFLRMVGIKNGGDIIGKTDYDLFEKEVADKYRADDERLISDGVSITDMNEIIPSDDGIQHYSSTSKFLLRDIGGNIIGLYGTGRDITEYRSTFDKLKLFTDSVRSGLATYICRGEVITPVYYTMLDYTAHNKSYGGEVYGMGSAFNDQGTWSYGYVQQRPLNNDREHNSYNYVTVDPDGSIYFVGYVARAAGTYYITFSW